jgi:hypothetical protein
VHRAGVYTRGNVLLSFSQSIKRVWTSNTTPCALSIFGCFWEENSAFLHNQDHAVFFITCLFTSVLQWCQTTGPTFLSGFVFQKRYLQLYFGQRCYFQFISSPNHLFVCLTTNNRACLVNQTHSLLKFSQLLGQTEDQASRILTLWKRGYTRVTTWSCLMCEYLIHVREKT